MRDGLDTAEGPGDGGAEVVRTSVFTVDHLPPKSRFSVWRESVSSIFDVERLPETDPEGFSGRIDSMVFGGMFLAQTRSGQLLWDRSARTIARDGMDHYMLQVYLEGGMAFERQGVEYELCPGQMIVYDLREDFHSRTGDFANISLLLPRTTLEPFLRAPDDQHARVLSEREPVVALLREHMISLMRHGPRMTAVQAREVVPATAAMTAACLNAGLHDRPGLVEGVGRTMLSLLKAHIEEHLTDRGLTTDRLARDFNLSRSKLYRLFQPLGGVASYVRERRLRYAMAELMDPTRTSVPIYLIAARAGFGDETDFSRAFRRRFGCTPRDVRRSSIEAASQSPMGGDGVDRSYEAWLRDLAA